MIGIDIEKYPNIDTVESISKYFFSDNECERIRKSYDMVATFTGIFCAREAIVKAIKSRCPDSSFNMKDFSLIYKRNIPSVIISDHIKQYGIRDIKISISHSGEYASSVAIIV